MLLKALLQVGFSRATWFWGFVLARSSRGSGDGSSQVHCHGPAAHLVLLFASRLFPPVDRTGRRIPLASPETIPSEAAVWWATLLRNRGALHPVTTDFPPWLMLIANTPTVRAQSMTSHSPPAAVSLGMMCANPHVITAQCLNEMIHGQVFMHVRNSIAPRLTQWECAIGCYTDMLSLILDWGVEAQAESEVGGTRFNKGRSFEEEAESLEKCSAGRKINWWTSELITTHMLWWVMSDERWVRAH